MNVIRAGPSEAVKKSRLWLGFPLAATDRISSVVLKGEKVGRVDRFDASGNPLRSFTRDWLVAARVDQVSVIAARDRIARGAEEAVPG